MSPVAAVRPLWRLLWRLRLLLRRLLRRLLWRLLWRLLQRLRLSLQLLSPVLLQLTLLSSSSRAQGRGRGRKGQGANPSCKGMPGAKGFVDSPSWFEERFGFKETTYEATRKRFEFADGVLTSTGNGSKFYVGPFETPSLDELRARLVGGLACPSAGSLSFKNITGAAKTLHLDPKNEGAIFQVASQFNCLEMNEPGARPEDGVTRYYCDATQGPACALSCPAATVYRNYLVNEGRGQAGKAQIDCLEGVGELLENGKNRYWKMVNGYCMPDAPGGIAKASKRIASDAAFAERARGALRVGVHWDTEVKGGSHRVCQVFSSALPIAYAKSVRSNDWAPLASAVLDASFEATLAVGAVLARQRGTRVTVFLTAVGGGAFGNRSMWIVQAMDRALRLHAAEPLDVRLVHFGSVPRGTYMALEERRAPVAAPAAPPRPARAAGQAAGAGTGAASSEAAPDSGDNEAERITALFARLDENGDGVIEHGEFRRVLQVLDPSFTDEVVAQLFEAADANGDGEVHYAEFVAWACNADPGVTCRVLR